MIVAGRVSIPYQNNRAFTICLEAWKVKLHYLDLQAGRFLKTCKKSSFFWVASASDLCLQNLEKKLHPSGVGIYVTFRRDFIVQSYRCWGGFNFAFGGSVRLMFFLWFPPFFFNWNHFTVVYRLCGSLSSWFWMWKHCGRSSRRWTRRGFSGGQGNRAIKCQKWYISSIEAVWNKLSEGESGEYGFYTKSPRLFLSVQLLNLLNLSTWWFDWCFFELNHQLGWFVVHALVGLCGEKLKAELFGHQVLWTFQWCQPDLYIHVPSVHQVASFRNFTNSTLKINCSWKLNDTSYILYKHANRCITVFFEEVVWCNVMSLFKSIVQSFACCGNSSSVFTSQSILRRKLDSGEATKDCESFVQHEPIVGFSSFWPGTCESLPQSIGRAGKPRATARTPVSGALRPSRYNYSCTRWVILTWCDIWSLLIQMYVCMYAHATFFVCMNACM